LGKPWTSSAFSKLSKSMGSPRKTLRRFGGRNFRKKGSFTKEASISEEWVQYMGLFLKLSGAYSGERMFDYLKQGGICLINRGQDIGHNLTRGGDIALVQNPRRSIDQGR